MRGADITQEELFSYRTLEERIPKKHPLRQLRKVVDLLLATLNDEFDTLYARRGRAQEVFYKGNSLPATEKI